MEPLKCVRGNMKRRTGECFFFKNVKRFRSGQDMSTFLNNNKPSVPSHFDWFWVRRPGDTSPSPNLEELEADPTTTWIF